MPKTVDTEGKIMATAYSQNGWTVIWENGPSLETIPVIIGKVRAGDVAVLFTDLLKRLEAAVNLNNTKDDWGWNVRPIRGQVNGYSNHASATAIDADATEHPRGVRGTWSASEKTKIHAILKTYDGVIRWGEDYNPSLSKVDGMHFEITGTAAKVKVVADRIRGNIEPTAPTKPKPTTPAKPDAGAHRAYQPGEVKAIQRSLNYAGYDAGPEDDDYGNRTEEAVRDYQRLQQFPDDSKALRADGDWGPTSQAHYEWTRRLQNTLNRWASVKPNLRIDGDLRTATTKAVGQVQRGNFNPDAKDAKKRGVYYAAGGRQVDSEPGPVTCKMLSLPTHP